VTLDEIQVTLDSSCVSVSHMGWAARHARGKPATKWSVVLVPAPSAGALWRTYEDRDLRWRGIGETLELAFEDALTKLAATILQR
jgi:hypothetical protein